MKSSQRWTARCGLASGAWRLIVGVAAVTLAGAADAEDVARFIVKFRAADAKAQIAPAARVERLAGESAIAIRHLRAMSQDADVVVLDRAVTPARAAQLAALLAHNPEVEYAQPDRLRQTAKVANDEFRNAQGYLDDTPGGISASLAWDVTTGSASTVVAVLDTGVRPHADLAGRILPGYDMISPTTVANDGNGRDADPSDPGDWVTASEADDNCPARNSSWHGTSVAGVIAANSNNAQWITGINWSAMILPVRVLGKCGGYDSDIIDGIAWAAGLTVPGVPANPYPAQVINMSLGGEGACFAAYQNAINAAYAHGVTRAIVAAAGNESQDVASDVPASCAFVYAVASTTTAGNLARYSNFGAGIDIAAPGGQYNSAIGNQGVITLSNSGLTTPAADSFTNTGGTSFAAPMVAGTISLMLAVAPNLTVDQVHETLRATAKPFPAGTTCDTTICGAGIVDANAAVRAAAALAPAGTVDVVEFYNAVLDHYFITYLPAEIANLDAGKTPTRWSRTGYGFKAYASAASAPTSPVCRFYIPPAKGDSHFFGRGTAECNATAANNPTFVLEHPAFMQMILPTAGVCPAGTTPIYRVFSNRTDANHRYMTERQLRDQMVAKGWVAEGDGPDLVVMCGPS
ncbi:MAG TPA: S8 family peptidase [Casimicrobiaceae bacterium]|nr:S8 family peptidase [Casimicrobiaceae bacterium]